MPDDPQYVLPHYSRGAGAYIYGTEYRVPTSQNNHNAPCAVCYVATRLVALMIPAKVDCPPSWTREYYGYLMTEYHGSSNNIHGRTMFECVDKTPNSVPGSVADTNGPTFHYVEATCDGMLCPPYETTKELNCAVCTK